MTSISRKVLRIAIYLLYLNCILFFLANNIYSKLFPFIIIILDQIAFIVDTLIRPSTQREKVDIATKAIGLLFLLHPFFFVILYYEYMFLTKTILSFLDQPVISIIGIILYIIGAVITLSSRMKLGSYGDGTTAMKDNQELITEGIYAHIRHPLYSGSLL